MVIKAAEYRTNRSIGRPRKRWEDDINEFLKQVEDETENLTENSNQINKSLINTAKDRGRWTLLEENYTTNSEGRHENNTRTRRNSHNIPARYVNGVKLSDEELADITQHNGKKIKGKENERKSKKRKWRLFFSESRSSSAISSARSTQ